VGAGMEDERTRLGKLAIVVGAAVGAFLASVSIDLAASSPSAPAIGLPKGTLFRVKKGVVTIRDFTSGRTLRLHAGQRYLAPNS
jgi:hypothetical protein